MELNGIFAPNVTLFTRHDEIDSQALQSLVETWLGARVSGGGCEHEYKIGQI